MLIDREKHRGWDIEFVHPPIPDRRWDYCATHPDYDGEGGSKKYLGSFPSKESAIQARKEAERLYGYHPNHGQIIQHQPESS